MKMLGKKWRYAVAAILLLGIGTVGMAVWRAQRALRAAAGEVQSWASLPFTTRLIAPAQSPFEWIAAPEEPASAAVFQGEFYLAGASGVFRYDSHGALIAHYRPGQELPPAPVLRIATGVLRGSGRPELLMATATEGIVAFDGAVFRQILPEAVEARSITSILPLGSGELLIGTRKLGVLVYDGKTLKTFHPALARVHVSELAGAGSDLWVGTQDQGVLHWRAGQTEIFGEGEGLPDAEVFSLALAGDRAYVGTAAGIAEFIDGRFARVLAPGLFARALYADKTELIAGGSAGIVEITPQGQRVPAVLRSRGRNIQDVQRFTVEDGTVYAVTGSGMFRKEPERGGWRRALSLQSGLLADRNVSALALDSAGALWVGYFDRGLDVLDPRLTSAVHFEDDNIFCVNRVVPNLAAGTVAVATANGLVVFDQLGRKQQVLGRSDGLLADHITDAAIYGSGMVLGTPAGLTFLDDAGPRSLYAFHGLVNNHVYTVAVAGREVIAGTLGGISVLENENVAANYTVATRGLSHNWISGIVRAGNHWMVGTYGGGIVRLLADGRFEAMDTATDKFEVYPNAMLATERHVFAGTLGRGLYVYDRGTNRWSVIKAGLPSLTVTALAEGKGFVYVGTDNGLVRIPEQNLP